MIRFVYLFFLSFALLLLFGCGDSSSTSTKTTFYPWEKTLRTHIESMQTRAVHKTVLLDGSKEIQTRKDVDWAQEFALFLEADLNKPAFETSYDNLSDDGFFWYSLKVGQNLPVKKFFMEVDGLGQPSKVEIEISQKNFLFETKKHLHMNFTDGQVETYSIDGTQQMRGGKPTHYNLMGVLLPK